MSNSSRAHEVGVVVSSKRYTFTLEGLPSARVNDLIVDADGNRAIVRALANNLVRALALGNHAQPGDQYQFVTDPYLYAVGDHLFGRVIDTFGRPIDGGGSFPPPNVPFSLEVEAPGIEVRQAIQRQLFTGVSVVDTMIPIARGQRQLIFGPIRSGKSTFLTETVQAQAGRDTICIYAVIGKPINGLRKITDTVIGEAAAESQTIVIAGLSDEPASVISLTPSVAFLLAEYFQQQGRDVLVVLDDLDAHAKYLREIALLEGRLPSTESYPGDVFYQHAHLMERSGDFTEAHGGGSITTLPVIQTDLKNFSDLIPTNLMACTDGHLAFRSDLRAEGIYPSISIEQSVTRVGRQAQRTLQKQVTRRVQTLLGSYRTQQEYAKFSADLSDQAKYVLARGQLVEQIMQQPAYHSRSIVAQVLLLGLVFSEFFVDRDEAWLSHHKDELLTTLETQPELADVRALVQTDDVTWEEFIAALAAAHTTIAQYVGHS